MKVCVCRSSGQILYFSTHDNLASGRDKRKRGRQSNVQHESRTSSWNDVRIDERANTTDIEGKDKGEAADFDWDELFIISLVSVRKKFISEDFVLLGKIDESNAMGRLLRMKR